MSRVSNELDDTTLEQAAEWVVRLNNAGVSEADFNGWQAWIAESPAHARAFSEIQDTWHRSASVPRTAMPTLARPPRFARRRVMRWTATPLAASVVIAAVGIAIWSSIPTVVATTTAELRSVRLPDDSLAALGPETRVEIDFTEHARSLRMTTGEAYFEVAREPARVFSVETPAGRIVAVGTAFSVHATPRRVAVSVTHGSVRGEPPVGEREESGGEPETSDAPNADDAFRARAMVVSSGQRFVRDGTRTEIEPLASADDAIAWQQRRLEYQGDPLRVVVSDINRYSGTKLRVADPALGELRYTGTVFPDTLDVWLTSIEGVFPVRVETRGSERLIVSAAPTPPP